VVRHQWRWQPVWLVAATRVGVRSGDYDLAREAASLAITAAERNPKVATMAGLAVQAQGLLRRDADTLGRAVEILGASPRPLVRADAAADHGRALLADRRRDAAVVALDNAWDIYSRVGAAGEARRIRRLLHDAGVRRRRWSSSPAPCWRGIETGARPTSRSPACASKAAGA
jgi:hypothetical protein